MINSLSILNFINLVHDSKCCLCNNVLINNCDKYFYDYANYETMILKISNLELEIKNNNIISITYSPKYQNNFLECNTFITKRPLDNYLIDFISSCSSCQKFQEKYCFIIKQNLINKNHFFNKNDQFEFEIIDHEVSVATQDYILKLNFFQQKTSLYNNHIFTLNKLLDVTKENYHQMIEKMKMFNLLS